MVDFVNQECRVLRAHIRISVLRCFERLQSGFTENTLFHACNAYFLHSISLMACALLGALVFCQMIIGFNISQRKDKERKLLRKYIQKHAMKINFRKDLWNPIFGIR
jgi:hypothetical protein